MNISNSSKEISIGSDFNIEYSSDSEKYSKSKSSNINLEFNSSSDNTKNNIFINKYDISSEKETFSEDENEVIVQLFNSTNKTSNNLNSIVSTKETSTSIDIDEIISLSSNTNSEENYKDNKSISINLIESSTNTNNTLSTNDTSILSISNLFNNETLSENSLSSKSSVKEVIIKEVEENMVSVGTNTEDLVMTLKIPFDTSKIVNVNEVTFGGVVNNRSEDNKKKELEELKKTLIKKNEQKMQRMFDMLLEKQNNEIESDIINFNLGIQPTKVQKPNEQQFQNQQQIMQQFQNQQQMIQQNLPIQTPQNNEVDEQINSEENSNNNSDPFRMEYNINKQQEKSESDEDKREKFLKKRKKELKLMAQNFKKEQEELKKDNNSDSSESRENVKERSKENNDSDDFEKRKNLRRERYLARRGIKKNIISLLFDKVYVITMEQDENRSKNLTQLLNRLGINHQISYGIDPNERAYQSYLQRWLHQTDPKKYPINKITFDHKLYLSRYPDLEEKGIKNKTRAWHHYTTSGLKEGRIVFDKSNIKNMAQLGCLLAHNRVYIDAIKNEYKSILVLEDDIYLHNNFIEELTKIYEKIPKNWNILYFGGIQKKWTGINTNNLFYGANNTMGAFAYGIRNNAFQFLKNNSLSLLETIDVYMQKLPYKYVIYPNLIITNLENSKIHRSRDINFYSKVFKWNLDDFDLELYDNIIEEDEKSS